MKVKLTQKSSGMYIMENNLDKFVQQLQDQIFEETKEVFGEVV